MTDESDELDPLARELATAFPPCEDTELKVDLWPRMLGRLESPPLRFGYAEAVIAGLLVLYLTIFPELIPVVLYNL